MKTPNFSGEAKLHFGAADFTIMETGAYVICAVTKVRIPLDRLKYWSGDLQEAYSSAAVSAKRWQEVNG